MMSSLAVTFAARELQTLQLLLGGAAWNCRTTFRGEVADGAIGAR